MLEKGSKSDELSDHHFPLQQLRLETSPVLGASYLGILLTSDSQKHTHARTPSLHALSPSCLSSYHGLRAGALPGEEVPEVGGFALLLRRLSHPDAALRGAAQAGAAAASAYASTASTAAQGEAEGRAQRAPPLTRGVPVLALASGAGLGQAEQVVVGVELTHVADGFT